MHHPLLDFDSFDQASGVLVHFTGGEDLTLFEVGESVNALRETLSPDADVILGASTEPEMNGRAQVILIFTGVGGRSISQNTASEGQPVISATVDVQASTASDDLDLPTFLRRRAAVAQRG
jgi:cell division protein FtsZ